MMKHPIATTAVLTTVLLMPAMAQADVIGLKAGISGWDMNADGSVGDHGQRNDFDFKDDTMASAWVAFEHPLPMLPNIKIRYNELNTDGSATVNDFDFGGRSYYGNAHVDLDFDHTDFILYYELLDDIPFSLDVGLNLKYADYKVKASGTAIDSNGASFSASSEESYNGVIPMLWASTEIDLPLTGLGVFGEISWTQYDDNKAYDFMAGAQYYLIDSMALDVTLQAGYRRIKIDVDDLSDISANTEFDGAFAGVQIHF